MFSEWSKADKCRLQTFFQEFVDKYWFGLGCEASPHGERLVLSTGNFMRGLCKDVVKADVWGQMQ